MRVWCACLLLVIVTGTPAEATEQTKNKGYGGMARLTNSGAKAEYLVVHDRKDKSGPKDYA